MTDVRAHILIVDDAPLIRGMFIQILQKCGYQVDTVENGQQAIEYVTSKSPDLILMDADMPVLDGIAAVTAIRQLPHTQHLPIIMVTAFVEREWVDRAYTAGAVDYVTKPVNWDVLRNRIHYILQAKHAEEALFEEKEKAQVTLASIADGVITTDAQGYVEYLNPIAAKLTGWHNEQASGLPLKEVFNIIEENTGQPIEFPVYICTVEGRMIDLSEDTVLIHRNGKKRFAIEDSAAPIRDRNGDIIGMVLVFHDVTENRKLTQKLSYQAKHDALTDLWNLHEFNARLEKIVNTTHPSVQKKNHQQIDCEHALLYMDLDRFKIVNDSCGHEAGDQLLRDVALILKKQTEKHHGFHQATLARLGGDEFGLLLENCSQQHALEVAHHLRASIEKFRFYWDSSRQERGIFTIGISIGLMMITADILVSHESILAMADAACYTAKNAGRNNIHVYQKEDAKGLKQEIQWLPLLRNNFEIENGFVLFYQPIVATEQVLSSQQTSHHYEILLRMNDGKGNLILPGAFLSTTERYNLMAKLDQWVTNKVLHWLTQYPQHVQKLSLVHINISGYSMGDKNFIEGLIHSLQDSHIPPEKLCFEVNETCAITSLSHTDYFANELKKLGCYFALDNFGSGIASFAYLKHLPVDFIKIDKALIQHMLTDSIDHAMVAAIHKLAHLMSLQTIAEHVEEEEIFKQLQTIGVNYIQGHWIAPAKPLYLDNFNP